ncbi:MAG: hypothetical protein ABIG92_05610 [Candidatus Omnitrophota bacterium]
MKKKKKSKQKTGKKKIKRPKSKAARKKAVKKVVKKKNTAKKSKKTIKIKKSTAKKKVSTKKSATEGVSLEEIGIVTHYFSRVKAAVVKITKGSLKTGDTIVIKGHTTDFKEKVASIQLDHAPIEAASVGQEIGLQVKSKVREHDIVYKIIG